MRWLSSAMCLILLTASGFATTLTGTLRYPDKSLVNGKIVLTPSYPGRVSTDSSVFVPAQVEYPVTNGTLPSNAQVWGNDVIEPTGTYYIVQVYNRLGELKFQAPYVVSGATYNLGSAAMSSVTTTNVSFVAALTNVANVWTAVQTFTSPVISGTITATGATLDGPIIKNSTLTGAATGNVINNRLLVGQQSAQTGTGAALAITSFNYTIPANTISSTSHVEIWFHISHSVGSASIAYTADVGDTTGVTLTSTTAANVTGMIVLTKGTVAAPNVISIMTTTWPAGAAIAVNAQVTVTTLVNASCAVTLKFNVAATDQIVPQQFIVKQFQ